MQKNIFRKSVVFGFIMLFLGASFVSAINSNIKPSNLINERANLNRDTYTFYPTDDVYIKKDHPDETFDIPYISIRNDYGEYGMPGFGWDGLIKFDISDISPGTTIDSATLNLFYYYYKDTNPAGRPITLYRALNNWDEKTVTWNTQPAYESQMSAFTTVPGNFDWMTWDVADDIQEFLDGQKENYGWKITDPSYWGYIEIPLTRFYSKESGVQIPYLEVETESTTSNPPYKPTIAGPVSGEKGVSYVYNATTTDPDGDQVHYLFDWGDETNSGWSDPYNSGATAYESHIWNLEGTFIVRVKACDTNGAVSDWSDPLLVTMPLDLKYNNQNDPSLQSQPISQTISQQFFIKINQFLQTIIKSKQQ